MIAVGQQLGGYTVQRRIGGGQMGEVFLAQHRRIARRAAIKALLPELSHKESVIEHFFKEARNTSLISHPGIIGILDCDINEGQAYVVMDFLQGESLGTYSKRNGALESDMAFLLGVVAQVAGAVGAAHEAGIMHRGLKPENIYLHLASPVGPTVSVKVLDFGVAQLSREDGGMSQTRSGILLGTPTYMSPEQCRGVGRTDARSDIYSLGCVLYEAICGRPPFVSRALGDVILAHVTEPPKAPSKLAQGLLPKLNSLILKMLAKSADERPQSMSEVVEALRICARAMDIDFEGALQPVTPVERPDYSAAAATPSPAGAAGTEVSGPTKPKPTSAPAPLPPRPAPNPASPPPIEPPRPAPSPPPSIEPPPPAPTSPPTPSIDPPPRPSPDSPPPPSIEPPAPDEQPVRVTSLADLLKGAQVSPSAPLPPFAARTPRHVPKTMILGEEPLEPHVAEQLAAQAQQVARATKGGSAGKVAFVAQRETVAPSAKADARDPLARLNALAGETMVLPQTGKGAKPDLRARGLEPARAGEPALPRALVGGTQVMPVANMPIPGRQSAAGYDEQAEEDRKVDPDEASDSEGHRETEQVGSSRRAGGERATWSPAQSFGTSRDAAATGRALLQAGARLWREKPRLILTVAGAVVVLGLVLAATVPMSGGAKTMRPSAGPPTGVADSPPPLPPAVRAPAPPAVRAPAVSVATSPGPKAPPETVRIDVHGIPSGTEVTVDGAPSALPVVVARGKDSHRIAVRTPDGTQQSVDVDGTRDRVVELVLPPSQPPRRKEIPAGGGNGPQRKSPGARPKGLDAITDK